MRGFRVHCILFCIGFALLFFAVSPMVITAENETYDVLSDSWIRKMLAKDPAKDPRSDSAQLRPVLNYDGEIIEVHSFKKERQGALVGTGWQLVGAVVDVIEYGNAKYILYGRRNLRYEGGLWNNVLDKSRSFEDYLVIKRSDNLSELLVHNRLKPTSSQTLIGLRLAEDKSGLVVLQNSPSGAAESIWSYRF